MYNDNLMRKSRFHVGDKVRWPFPKTSSARRASPFLAKCAQSLGDHYVNRNGEQPSGPHPMGFRYEVNCKDSPNRRPQQRYKEWELVLVEDENATKCASMRMPHAHCRGHIVCIHVAF